MVIITIQDFKDYFLRGFDYLPTWINSLTYNTNDVVFLESSNLFYVCKKNNVTSNPSASQDDWALSIRFKKNNFTLDSDITNGIKEAEMFFNKGLFSDEELEQRKIAFLNLTAHQVLMEVQTHSVSLTSSTSVGSVSESYTIPEWALKNPAYSGLSKSKYGVKYLQLIESRRLVKTVGLVYGGTTL